MSNCVCTWNLWYCNVVEPVIKDVIVTKEYHELCSLTRQWSFISFVASPVFYRSEWLVALKRLPCTVENVTVHSQRKVVDWLNKKKINRTFVFILKYVHNLKYIWGAENYVWIFWREHIVNQFDINTIFAFFSFLIKNVFCYLLWTFKKHRRY